MSITLEHGGRSLTIDARDIYEVYSVRMHGKFKFIIVDRKGIETIFDNLTRKEIAELESQYEKQTRYDK